MNTFYLILLIAYLLKTIAGIPLLYYVYITKQTDVIPYSTLILMMTSGMLLFYTALSFKYYLHAVIYLVFFIVYALIFIIKYHAENFDYLTDQITQNPTDGIISGDENVYLYVPNNDYYGVDQFKFIVTDGLWTSNEATINIFISPINVSNAPS